MSAGRGSRTEQRAGGTRLLIRDTVTTLVVSRTGGVGFVQVETAVSLSVACERVATWMMKAYNHVESGEKLCNSKELRGSSLSEISCLNVKGVV